MVLEQDQKRQALLAQALMEKGFHVLCVESLDAAECFVRMDIVDVLVLGERVGGRLSHSLALLAECRNPMVSAILLTERTGPDMDELFDLIPAVYAILGRDVAPRVVTQIVMSAISAQVDETPRVRTARRWQAAEAAAQDVEDADFDDMPTSVTVLPAISDHPADFAAAWAESLELMAVAEPADAAYSDRDHLHVVEDKGRREERFPAPAEIGVADGELAMARWYRTGHSGQGGTHAGTGVIDGPIVAARGPMLPDLPVFAPITLMQADAPRRRLHLG